MTVSDFEPDPLVPEPGDEDTPVDPMTQMAMGMLFAKCMDELHHTTQQLKVVLQVMKDPIAGVLYETLHNVQVIIYSTRDKLAADSQCTLVDTPLADWADMIKKFVLQHGGSCPCCDQEDLEKGITELENFVNEDEENKQ